MPIPCSLQNHSFILFVRSPYLLAGIHRENSLQNNNLKGTQLQDLHNGLLPHYNWLQTPLVLGHHSWYGKKLNRYTCQLRKTNIWFSEQQCSTIGNNINSTCHHLEAIRVCWKYCCMEVTTASGELKCQILPPFFPSEELFFSLCKAGDSNCLIFFHMCFGHAIRTWHKRKVRLENTLLFQLPMSATKLVKTSHHKTRGCLHFGGVNHRTSIVSHVS
jgi:hypothetical protein